MRNKRFWMTNLFLIFALISSAFAAPDVQTYDGLLRAIREVRLASEQRMEQEKVRVAWETGKLIDAHVLGHKERADYGEKVLARLAGDLESSPTELRYMLRFFRAYPIQPTSAELSWSRYREILSLDETEARKEVADKAVQQKWSVKQVREEVRRRQAGSKSQEEKLPVSAPGNLYTYRVVKPAEGPYRDELALDLGFSVTFRPREFGLKLFKEGDRVALRNGKLMKVDDEPLGTYQAYVTEIIDADTVHARIDLGFGITIHQKLRFRGLDAPALESSDGREAKAFLEEHLAASGATVLVQTTKPDKYDRYLADIWTLRSDPATNALAGKQASSGSARTTGDKRWAGETHINQQLIDQGLAVRVNE